MNQHRIYRLRPHRRIEPCLLKVVSAAALTGFDIELSAVLGFALLLQFELLTLKRFEELLFQDLLHRV